MTDDWDCFGLILPFIFYLSCQLCEALVNIGSWFWADFKKLQIMFFRQDISFFKCDLSFFIEIAFCSYQQFADIFWRIVIDLLDPAGDVVERPTVCDGICKNDTCCSFVVSLSDVSKSLLACGIPDLHFDSFVINLKHFYFEVYSYCCDIVLFEYSFAEVSEKVCFSYSAVTDYDDF